MPPKKVVRTEVDTSDAQRALSTPSLSLNPIFACTGPRSGQISFVSGQRMLEEFLDTVDNAVYLALQEAWDRVAVPANDYWCMHPQQTVVAASHQTRSGISDVRLVKVPNPRELADSFYSTRLAALRGHSYRTNGGLVVVAVDRRAGNASKLFSVLSRDSRDTSTAAAPHGLGDSSETAGDGDRDKSNQAVAGPSSNSAPSHGTASLGASTVAGFVAAIPQLCDRSLYVLVDEEAAVDPFFDVDCSFIAPSPFERGGATASAVTAFNEAFPWWAVAAATNGREPHLPPVPVARIEELLYTVVSFLKGYFERRLTTRVEECLVTTSSMQLAQCLAGGEQSLVELKLSFHVHFRLSERAAMASVRDLHLFMNQLREHLSAVATGEGDAERAREALFGDQPLEEAAEAAVVVPLRRCVDFGVYSRWRAFRLPYNVKTPFATDARAAAAFTPVDAAVDDLLMDQLAQCGVAAEVPDVTVGAAANSVVQQLVLSADTATRATQTRVLQKMSFAFRFLLPLVAGVTELQHEPLRRLLDGHAPSLPRFGNDTLADRERFAAVVMDLATIQRDNTATSDEAGTGKGALRLLRWQAESETGVVQANAGQPTSGASGSADPSGSPFADKKPPRPHCARVPVTERATLDLLAEVFLCLAPHYAGLSATLAEDEQNLTEDAAAGFALPDVASNQGITGGRITAQYEEAIRSYYVFQKLNKYCLRQRRTHKATFVQLYLTFSSIKVRCYSNDCCDRCLFIPWSEPPQPVREAHFTAGYPRYDRLLQIRELLFPPLPLDELVRRYGPQVLEEVRVRQHREQQQQLAEVAQDQTQPQAAGV